MDSRDATQLPKVVVPAAELAGPRSPLAYQTLQVFLNPTTYMLKCHERYGSTFRMNIIPGAPLYVLTDPDDVKAMFLAPRDVLHTGNGSASLEKFFGQSGLAFLDEEEHLTRRKALMPSVKGKALARIEQSVGELAGRIVAGWPRNEVVALHPHVHRFTVQVIREVIFGEFVPSCWDELFEVIWDMLGFNSRVVSVIETHTLSPRTFRLLKAIKPLGFGRFFDNRARADALIAQAVAERLDAGVSGDDMLSMLLGFTRADGSSLSAVEIRDEIMTMFLAGTETTAAGICWAFEYLSREPAVLERLVAEIDEGADDAYLTATIHEALRVRPPTPQIIPREVVKPIEIGGVRYEPGSYLWASGYLLHHDPDLYPDPHAFRPERWLGAKPSAHTWIPFGGGHTRCLGDRIALVEMKAVLREVLATCVLHRPDPTPEAPRNRAIVVMLSGKGTRLELRDRVGGVQPAGKTGHRRG